MDEKIKTKHAINNAHIIMIKAIHNLTTADIAELTGKKPTTVNTWFTNPTSSGYRRAPDDAARILMGKYSLEIY
ncbi:hypothetical protein [Piscirickettsia litoralis]|uniref:HTH cro/C1-type domain-containing protein n=1 Tax=Piscirickettsia litoralis TaxID=1891921 RepID=A0ABX2ZY42_9GAMM|nr:hypothetical protein [Piscirickettsia litoralis]ODN41148.1 hypothetical protein BGC07_17900 [Piscirickettsia litoralis]